MPKRKCVFTSKLKEQYPFVESTKINYEVYCTNCHATFFIAHGGNSDILQHQKTKKHKLGSTAAATSSKMSTFFPSTALDMLTEYYDIEIFRYLLLSTNKFFKVRNI